MRGVSARVANSELSACCGIRRAPSEPADQFPVFGPRGQQAQLVPSVVRPCCPSVVRPGSDLGFPSGEEEDGEVKGGTDGALVHGGLNTYSWGGTPHLRHTTPKAHYT